MPHRTAWKIALLVFLASLPLKLLLAQNMAWEIDYVPLIWRGWQFLQGGPFPAVGTLSSVAAYNMPFLVWMHLPALALTHHAALAMLLTMLVWNALTTAYLYALGRSMFRPSVGLLAVFLFSFSPSGISAAYTSWAQLLLPGFYIMTLYHLWQWSRTNRARHLTLCGVIALCAFMTHFSAIVLFPAMFIGALLLRARWSIKALVVGVVIGAVLLAPYLAFEVGRGFTDIRAFTSRKVQVVPEVMAQYERYKIDYAAPESVPAVAATQSNPAVLPQETPIEALPTASIQDRIFSRLRETWQHIVMVVAFPSTQEFYAVPSLNFVPSLMTLSVWGAVLWALYRTGRLVYRSGRRNAWAFWRESDAARALFVAGFGLLAAGLMIVLRAGQYTYYMGLLSLIYLLIAYGWMEIWRYKYGLGRILVIVLIGLWLAGNVSDRLTSHQRHNDAQFTPFNAALYRHAEVAVDLIAQDWAQSAPLTISYDLLPEVPNFWWLPAWGNIDPLYRMGAPYDVLLDMKYGLVNRNTSPLGPIDDPDYLVIYTLALKRYDMDRYTEIGRAGTTVVLKPIEK
jgi:hypothetical protein